jgi:hypothetical protein
VGVVLTATLVVTGVGLSIGSSFIHNQVHSQLAAQKIYFPPKGSPALSGTQIQPYLTPYAGQQLLTGTEAEVWADHFIAVHLQEIGGGQTYSQLSTKAMADPTNTKLAGQVQSMFQGQSLRSMLLTAYAFDTMATVAAYGAIIAFALALLMLAMILLGLRHYRRVDPEVVVA